MTEKKSELFTASGTWTQPTDVTSVIVTLVGGGGGSQAGGGGAELARGGGGAGQCLWRVPCVVSGDVL